ncbi:MAG TPA: MFS transporter [Woeseiaceae bacterium]|nr:MFS transporter [Woeseiaceae bacterium]
MAEARAEPGVTRNLYDLLTGDEDARVCRDIPEEACREQPRNFFMHIASLVATKTGDLLSSPKVVLSWLLINVGAPGFMLGFLVPVRESLALLPQLFVAGYIRRVSVRKWFWVVASVVEGFAIAAMAAVAVTMRGAAAGWSILALLVVFSLARGVASIADKDVLGKTISKSRRGMASGYASSLAGAIAVATGLFWLFIAPNRQGAAFFATLLGAAGALWILAALLFSRIVEYAGATEGGGNAFTEAVRQLALIRRDRDLRQFLIVRTLLLSTALAAPFYVALASRESGGAVSRLGALLIASGAAGFVSAPVWGRLSDRSSRRTMSAAALLAAVAGFFTVAVSWTEGLPYSAVWLTLTYFLLNVAHEGVRVGRKTHLIDIATVKTRASYVAVSNTIIGVMLLAGSAFGGLVSIAGPAVAVLVLSVVSLAASAAALRLEEAQQP